MIIQKKILIVDDEKDLIVLFHRILTLKNYAVTTAQNGVEALDSVKKETPDLILLDVHMPVMDGYETIKRLRQMKALKFTPIVFLSGFNTSPEEIESGYSLGATEYWKKPMSVDELSVRVRSILSIAEADAKVRKLQQSFYSMAVHDLRNPIGAVMGYVEILMEEKKHLNSFQIEMITGIIGAAEHLQEILNDLLELTHFESGEYTLKRKQIPMIGLINQLLPRFRPIIDQKKITVSVSDGDIPDMSVDIDFMSEVFENLFDNAVRYTPPNGTISVKTELLPSENEQEHGSVIIRLSDNGPGIAADEIPTLFDKNRITNIKLRKSAARTGLGLSICREIVEAHGGTITVFSIVGEGTSFIIQLPITPAE